MKCSKAEKWISDRVDGALPAGREGLLQSHLSTCPSCRDHARQILRLVEEVGALYPDEAGIFDGKDFSSRLRNKLSLSESSEPKVFQTGRRQVWRWAAASASLLLILGLQLLFKTDSSADMWANLYPYSYESTLSEISWEIQQDRRLEDIFNSLILASIEEELDEDEVDIYGGYIGGSFLLEDLSDEDLKILEEELKKDITS
jgi:hypothetical protein